MYVIVRIAALVTTVIVGKVLGSMGAKFGGTPGAFAAAAFGVLIVLVPSRLLMRNLLRAKD